MAQVDGLTVGATFDSRAVSVSTVGGKRLMKAVGYKQPLPITDPHSLLDIELPIPVASARDLLVEVKAVSVNPVDTKMRASSQRRKAHIRCWDSTLRGW